MDEVHDDERPSRAFQHSALLQAREGLRAAGAASVVLLEGDDGYRVDVGLHYGHAEIRSGAASNVWALTVHVFDASGEQNQPARTVWPHELPAMLASVGLRQERPAPVVTLTEKLAGLLAVWEMRERTGDERCGHAASDPRVPAPTDPDEAENYGAATALGEVIAELRAVLDAERVSL